MLGFYHCPSAASGEREQLRQVAGRVLSECCLRTPEVVGLCVALLLCKSGTDGKWQACPLDWVSFCRHLGARVGVSVTERAPRPDLHPRARSEVHLQARYPIGKLVAPAVALVPSSHHWGSLAFEQLLIVSFVLLLSSLCKGRTLYSVVRDAKIVLDVNKTRQIAQEIVKVP